MNKRIGLKVGDKLMVGNVDSGEVEYIDITDLETLIGNGTQNLRKNGYRWIKGDGNISTANYEIGDEIIGVGTLYGGFAIHGYIKASPTSNPNEYVTIIASSSKV